MMFKHIYDKVKELIFILYRGMYVVSAGIVVLVLAMYFAQHELQWEYLLIAVVFYTLAACLSFYVSYLEYRYGLVDENDDFGRQPRKLMNRAAGLFVFSVAFYVMLKCSHIKSDSPYLVVAASVFAGFALVAISLLSSSLMVRKRKMRYVAQREDKGDTAKNASNVLLPLSACGVWSKCLVVLAAVCVVLCCVVCILLYPTFPKSVALVAGSVALLAFCHFAVRANTDMQGLKYADNDAFTWAIDIAFIDFALVVAIFALVM